MKRYLFITPLLLSFAAIFSSCSEIAEGVDSLNAPNEVENLASGAVKISKAEASEIANTVLHKANTRSAGIEEPMFDYIVKQKGITSGTERRKAAVDTLAYVVNYPENGGFVIVASDADVYPVIGFSEKGHFDVNDETIQDCVIANIGNYITKEKAKSVGMERTRLDGLADFYEEVSPIVDIYLYQFQPWNNYLIRDGMSSDTRMGCVAIAAAAVMSYSKNSLTYHGLKFDFSDILPKIYIYQKKYREYLEWKKNPEGKDEPEIGNNVYPASIEYAVDQMAHFLYLIAKDVDMKFSSSGSLAVPDRAYDLIKSLGFSMETGFENNFELWKVANYLKDGHIIYTTGNDQAKDENGNYTSSPVGHAWVIDGCGYKYFSPTFKLKIEYLHCYWGFGGASDGYFAGSIFDTPKSDYTPTRYFAIYRETKNLFE